MPFNSRHTENLLKGRVSNAGAYYFLTWCTAGRAPLLRDDPNRSVTRRALSDLNAASDGMLLAGTVMLDHIHLLFELGPRLTVSQVAAKTKAAVTRAAGRAIWQLNFFEHRLRNVDSTEDYAFYIFMNPYCAGLCSLDHDWPGWVSSGAVRWEFQDKLIGGRLPQPEWINQARRFGVSLPEGAD